MVGSTDESASIANAIDMPSSLDSETLLLLLTPRLKTGISADDKDGGTVDSRGGERCKVANAVVAAAAAEMAVTPDEARTASKDAVKAPALQSRAPLPFMIGSTVSAAAKVDDSAGATTDAEADEEVNETVRRMGLALFEARAAAHDDDQEADEAVSDVEVFSADEVEEEASEAAAMEPVGCMVGYCEADVPRATEYAPDNPPPPIPFSEAEARIDQDCDSERAAASGVIDATSTSADESKPLRLPPWLLLRLRPAARFLESLPAKVSAPLPSTRAGERKPDDDWRKAGAMPPTPTKATEEIVRARCGVENVDDEAVPFTERTADSEYPDDDEEEGIDPDPTPIVDADCAFERLLLTLLGRANECAYEAALKPVAGSLSHHASDEVRTDG